MTQSIAAKNRRRNWRNANRAFCRVVGYLRKVYHGEPYVSARDGEEKASCEIVVDFSHEKPSGEMSKDLALFRVYRDEDRNFIAEKRIGDRICVSFFPSMHYAKISGARMLVAHNIATRIKDAPYDVPWWRQKHAMEQHGGYTPPEK